MLTVVRACLRDGTGGSPTVVLDDLPMPLAERCALPACFGASHAVFLAPGNTLRFSTAEGELPACGHATVAALAVLALRSGRADHVLRVGGRSLPGRAVRMFASGESSSAAGAGSGASATGDRFDAVFDPGPITVRPATPEPSLARPSLAEICAAIGAEAASEPCIATLGRPRLLLPIADRAALAALRPDFARLKAATDRLGLLGCYVYSIPDSHGRAAARMFAPSIGVPEDIANANSTACLAAHLARDVHVDMGDALGSPATVKASARGATIQVGGEVWASLTGTGGGGVGVRS